MSRKCDTCGRTRSSNYYTCIHALLDFGFTKKGQYGD